MKSDIAMAISPHYTVIDWRQLNLDRNSGDWEKAICIFDDRIRGRYINPANHINQVRRDDFTGFAVLALDCDNVPRSV